jgi:hypothetical protein
VSIEIRAVLWRSGIEYDMKPGEKYEVDTIMHVTTYGFFGDGVQALLNLIIDFRTADRRKMKFGAGPQKSTLGGCTEILRAVI